MNEPTPEYLKEKGWGNCSDTRCGYFFNRSKLERCPACRHQWRLPASFQQPTYEPPTLS